MKEILVTGGLGHIGSSLIRHLPQTKYRITVVDNMETQRYSSLFDLKGIAFWEMDFDDLSISQLEKFDAVIHLAARTDAASSIEEKEKTFDTNVTKTIRLIEKIGDKTHFIFPSSTSVYGKGQKVMYENEDNVDPQSPYAESKNSVEKSLLKSQITFNILRFGTIFGTSIGMRFHTAINKFCYQACLGNNLTVWRQNYDHHRPYLGLRDACDAIEMCLQGKLQKNETYNVLSDNARLSDIILMIQECVDANVDFVDTPLLNQHTYYVNDDKIKKRGFTPKDSLESGIYDTISILKGIRK